MPTPPTHRGSLALRAVAVLLLSGCDAVPFEEGAGAGARRAVLEAEINGSKLPRADSTAKLVQEQGLLLVEGAVFGGEVHGIHGIELELWLRPEALLGAPLQVSLPIDGDAKEQIDGSRFTPAVGHSQVVERIRLKPQVGCCHEALSQHITGSLVLIERSLTRVVARVELSAVMGDDEFTLNSRAAAARRVELTGEFAALLEPQFAASSASLQVAHAGESFRLSDQHVRFLPFEPALISVWGFAALGDADRPDGSAWLDLQIDVRLPSGRLVDLKPGTYRVGVDPIRGVELRIFRRGQPIALPSARDFRGEIEVLRNTGGTLEARGALELAGVGPVDLEFEAPYEERRAPP